MLSDPLIFPPVGQLHADTRSLPDIVDPRERDLFCIVFLRQGVGFAAPRAAVPAKLWGHFRRTGRFRAADHRPCPGFRDLVPFIRGILTPLKRTGPE